MKYAIDNPESLVREYEGEDLEKIGKHLSEISSYNYNFYRLPNGTIILMISDDDNCSDVFVMDGPKQSRVGIQYDGGVFEIGDFS